MLSYVRVAIYVTASLENCRYLFWFRAIWILNGNTTVSLLHKAKIVKVQKKLQIFFLLNSINSLIILSYNHNSNIISCQYIGRYASVLERLWKFISKILVKCESSLSRRRNVQEWKKISARSSPNRSRAKENDNREEHDAGLERVIRGTFTALIVN